jgi:hypothetical protein
MYNLSYLPTTFFFSIHFLFIFPISLLSLLSHIGRIIAAPPNPFIGIGDEVDTDVGCCGAQPIHPKELLALFVF